MKLFNLIICFVALFAMTACSNVSNFREQGGARTVIGGELDIVSGGELKIAGTTVTATAAELNGLAAASQAADGTLGKKVVRATYDFAVDGGAISTIDLGEDLPANALITQSYIYVVTQLTDGGSGTIAIQCEDANNIKTATDITGTSAGGFVAGESTGVAGDMVGGIAAACDIELVIAGAALTAGKFIVYVEYVVAE